jgi:hypothetical protein
MAENSQHDLAVQDFKVNTDGSVQIFDPAVADMLASAQDNQDEGLKIKIVIEF